MKQDSSTQSWNRRAMAEEWIALAQSNPERIHFIMPFTLQQLGDVSGKSVLDVGCGEGGYSRELAVRGARVVGIDCAEAVISYCRGRAREEGLDIAYRVCNSCELDGIADASFDVALASMMLMDCEDFEGTVREIHRVLKPSGRLFASVLHPCFAVNGEGIGRMDEGINRKVVVSNYFEPRERLAPIVKGASTPVIWRHRTMQEYVKTFLQCGFVIADMHEPVPGEEQAKIAVLLDWLRKIPIFLFWDLRKP